MHAKLRPGHHFHDFLNRADAARQRDKRIRFLEHEMLALMHVANDDEFGQLFGLFEACFLVEQKGRDNAGNFAAGIHHALRNRAHDAARASAINKAQAVFGNGPTECNARFAIDGIQARGRAAINTNGSNLRHDFLCAFDLSASSGCDFILRQRSQARPVLLDIRVDCYISIGVCSRSGSGLDMKNWIVFLGLTFAASSASAGEINIKLPDDTEVTTNSVLYKCGENNVSVTYYNAGDISLAELEL